MVIQADGKIVAAGGQGGFILARYTSEGTPDLTFGTGGQVFTDFGGSASALGMGMYPDGKIVLAGFAIVGGRSDFALARYNSNGSLDANFGAGGKVITDLFGGDDGARTVSIQSGGKILAAGSTNSGAAFVRYNPDGSLDTTFGTGGKVAGGPESGVAALGIQWDGKMLVAGTSSLAFRRDFALVRYNSDGTLDNTFGAGGQVSTDFGGNDQASALTILPDGKILVSGFSDSNFALARYVNEVPPPPRPPRSRRVTAGLRPSITRPANHAAAGDGQRRAASERPSR